MALEGQQNSLQSFGEEYIQTLSTQDQVAFPIFEDYSREDLRKIKKTKLAFATSKTKVKSTP